MNEEEILKLHFAGFELDEMLEVIMDEEYINMRQSTLPNDWYVFIRPETLEKLKLSLLISNCVVQQEEDSSTVEITRTVNNGNTK